MPDLGAFGSGSLTLDLPSGLPGGSATLSGRNCPPGSTVTYTVQGGQAGTTTASADGTFGGALQLPDAPLGEYAVDVTCAGQKAALTIDLVVSSGVSTPASATTAGAVIVFFVLFGSVLLSGNSRSRRSPIEVDPDDSPDSLST